MKYIKGFDGLRAFAILFVLWEHLCLNDYLPQTNFIQNRLWLVCNGAAGVWFFFAISGFLITRMLLIEKEQNKKISFKKFYFRRFSRLLPPLLIFYFLIAFFMHYQMIQYTKIGFLFSFFYLYNFVPNQYYTIELGHTWSLGVEEQFYLLWPIVINYLNTKKILFLSLLLILMSIIFKFVYPVSWLHYCRPDRWFVPAVAPILIGSLFSLMLFENQIVFETYFRNKKGFFVAICLFSPIYLPIKMLPYAFLFQATGISIFLTWIFENQEHFLVKSLEFKPIAYIGKISYGIYVFQGFFVTTGKGSPWWIQQFPYNLIFTLIAAIFSYHFIEKKVKKWKEKFSQKHFLR